MPTLPPRDSMNPRKTRLEDSPTFKGEVLRLGVASSQLEGTTWQDDVGLSSNLVFLRIPLECQL